MECSRPSEKPVSARAGKRNSESESALKEFERALGPLLQRMQECRNNHRQQLQRLRNVAKAGR
ncbi:MAG: hypothetical protein AB1898_09570 [Acidobacteriota bacterium]